MTTSPNILVYVDRPLAIAIASKLVGVLSGESEGRQAKVGFNWLVSTEAVSERASSRQQDIRELLPEDLVYAFYDLISPRGTSLTEAIDLFATPTSLPGRVLSVEGRLHLANLRLRRPEPTIEPATDVEIPSVVFHGQSCVFGELQTDRHSIPVYFPEQAKFQIGFCDDQPVEITGVLRWVPPYSPQGGRSCNLALQCAALWLA